MAESSEYQTSLSNEKHLPGQFADPRTGYLSKAENHLQNRSLPLDASDVTGQLQPPSGSRCCISSRTRAIHPKEKNHHGESNEPQDACESVIRTVPQLKCNSQTANSRIAASFQNEWTRTKDSCFEVEIYRREPLHERCLSEISKLPTTLQRTSDSGSATDRLSHLLEKHKTKQHTI